MKIKSRSSTFSNVVGGKPIPPRNTPYDVLIDGLWYTPASPTPFVSPTPTPTPSAQAPMCNQNPALYDGPYIDMQTACTTPYVGTFTTSDIKQGRSIQTFHGTDCLTPLNGFYLGENNTWFEFVNGFQVGEGLPCA